jgi:protein O-mannosyl-transferase
LVVATVVAYGPIFHAGFIFDDNVFLTDNPLIAAADGLRRLWFSREAADYWPVTSSTLWLEWRAWGANATGYHVTNLVLHLAEVLLLWAVLKRLRVPGAFWGALLFALHPLNAESVAWITQRKNLMAMLFYLLSVYGFVASEERVTGDSTAATARRSGIDPAYILSLGAFVLAMLSKGAVVMAPFVLLGLVLSRRRPTGRDGLRLAPFFAAAAALAWFESTFSTVLTNSNAGPHQLLERGLRAAAMVWFYLGKAVWPANLGFDYGRWSVHPNEAISWLPLIAAVGVTIALWLFRRRGTRGALLAWAYFGVMLAPALGFAEVGFMRYSPVSNHYTHLALIGIAALAGAAFARSAGGSAISRTIAQAAMAAALVTLGALTWQQARVYADGERLYRDTIARNPRSEVAHINLGVTLINAGRFESAEPELRRAVQLAPDSAKAHGNLGVVCYRLGRIDEAIAEYREALRLDPEFFEAHNNLGAALARSGRLQEALGEFRASLRINPAFSNARQNVERAERMLRSSP